MAKTSLDQGGKNSMAGLVAVVMTIIGVAAGYLTASVTIRQSAYDTGYKAGSADATKKAKDAFEASGIVPEVSGPVTSIFATVTAVDGSTISVNAAQLSRDPFAAQTPTMRRVTVTSSTKIYKDAALSPAELSAAQEKYAAVLAAFSKSPTPGAQPPLPPSPVKRTEAKLSDIAASAQISVTAGQDIRNATDIEATEIDILPAAAAPSPAAPTAPTSQGAVPAPDLNAPTAPTK